MKVSIIIINWNGQEKLAKYLPDILKVEDVDEVIVTDDASTDGSIDFLRQNYPEVKLVIRDKNGGFSSNVNTGVKEAQGDLIFLLNPDAVPDVDCVTRALPYFKDNSVFSLSCNTGGNWSWVRWEGGFIWHYMSKGEPVTHQTLWARGGSGIFRKSLFLELGGMDELYNPFYEEDVDLGYRATKRGYKNLWVKECRLKLPKERGVIAANISEPKFSKIAQRNQLLFIWKNITSEKLSSDHKKALLKMLATKPGYWPVYLSARARAKQAAGKRQVEIKEQKITDEQLFEMF